jgi:nitrite reductase (NAD(P)H)
LNGDFTPKSTSQATSVPLAGAQNSSAVEPKANVWKTSPAEVPKKRHGHGPAEDDPIECLVYRDPFSGVYKKYIFSADGKYLLGGMMVRP